MADLHQNPEPKKMEINDFETDFETDSEQRARASRGQTKEVERTTFRES